MQKRDREISRVRNGIAVEGREETINSVVVNVIFKDDADLVTLATGLTVPTTGSAGFAKNATFVKTDASSGVNGSYTNVGTSSSALFVASKGVTAVAVTANDDGLTTAIIPAYADFVTVTSAGATKNVSLPACSSANIGKTLRVFVGANGLELLTASATNDTINAVDADGTNQLDVPASSIVHLTQITATGWYAFVETSSALSVVAPDND